MISHLGPKNRGGSQTPLPARYHQLLLAEHRQRPPAPEAKPSCPDVQGNFGAADGSAWDGVGGEHCAGGAVGQVEDDGSNASWNRSDVGSEEAEDMGEGRDMIEGREEEEAEEVAEEGTPVELVELDESDEGSDIEHV